MEDKILKAARKLGKEIGKSRIWKDFRKASEQFRKDEEIQKLLEELREKEKVQSVKLEQGMPIEVSEKRAIKEIEETLSSNAVFLAFIECENRYLALMGNIDRAIKEGTDQVEEEGGEPGKKEKGKNTGKA